MLPKHNVQIGKFHLRWQILDLEPQVTHVDPHSLAHTVSESLKFDQLRIRKVSSTDMDAE